MSTFASRGPLRTKGRAVAGLFEGAVPTGFMPGMGMGREDEGCCGWPTGSCCGCPIGLRPGAVDAAGGMGRGLGAELTDRGEGAAPYWNTTQTFRFTHI
jgi:hypothetical protein